MRIQIRLPRVHPNEYKTPEKCPYGCGSEAYQKHGVKGEKKAIRDIGYSEVVSYRYKCMKCGRTFRVYPRGVSKGAQQSERLRAMTIMLYVLGLSYGAVEDFTNALGCGVGKTTAYNNVQAAGVVARRRQEEAVRTGGKRAVVGADATFVKVQGVQTGIEIVVDDQTGELLGLDIIESENSEEILEVLQGVLEGVEAEVLVTDDHRAYPEIVDETGVAHQLCRKHIQQNVEELCDSFQEQLKQNEPPPPGQDLSREQLESELEQLERLVWERPEDGEAQLEQLYDRYKGVPTPSPGSSHPVWYRMRMLITRLWERWRKFTLDQQREDLDGTNNASERLIGWWIKERYRTMRGYKRTESIRNVVTLTARMGAFKGYYDMTDLMA